MVNTAFCAAKRMSAYKTITKPMPAIGPLIAAMIGFFVLTKCPKRSASLNSLSRFGPSEERNLESISEESRRGAVLDSLRA